MMKYLFLKFFEGREEEVFGWLARESFVILWDV
jgi:hypothetical protein